MWSVKNDETVRMYAACKIFSVDEKEPRLEKKKRWGMKPKEGEEVRGGERSWGGGGGGAEMLEGRAEGLGGCWQVILEKEVVSGMELIKMWFVVQAA